RSHLSGQRHLPRYVARLSSLQIVHLGRVRPIEESSGRPFLRATVDPILQRRKWRAARCMCVPRTAHRGKESAAARCLAMGLDLVVEGCARPGHELEWRRILQRSFAGEEPSEADIARFREISIPGYQRLDAPRVGFDGAADAWIIAARQATTPEAVT